MSKSPTKIFISWSKEKSRLFATALNEWFYEIIEKPEIFVSKEDISHGKRWFETISHELDDTGFAIICVTAENRNEPWLLFEAGAISKRLESETTYVILFDMKKSSLSGPLSHFNLAEFNKPDVFKLILKLNESRKDKKIPYDELEESFDRWWNTLRKRIDGIKHDYNTTQENKIDTNPQELIEETLNIARELNVQMRDIKIKMDGPYRFRSNDAFVPDTNLVLEYMKKFLPEIWKGYNAESVSEGVKTELYNMVTDKLNEMIQKDILTKME